MPGEFKAKQKQSKAKQSQAKLSKAKQSQAKQNETKWAKEKKKNKKKKNKAVRLDICRLWAGGNRVTEFKAKGNVANQEWLDEIGAYLSPLRCEQEHQQAQSKESRKIIQK